MPHPNLSRTPRVSPTFALNTVFPPRCSRSAVLLNLDAVAHHPQVKLFEASHPAAFGLPHPSAIRTKLSR